MRKKAGYVVIVLAALAAVELFLRIIWPYELAFDCWFSRGIHSPSQEFGYVFTPHFSGFMRHRDRVDAYLGLDGHGFRQPALSGAAPDTPTIVFIGGRSQMFGYGLPDGQTIPARTGAALDRPLKVYNTAWPGFDIHRNFHIYKRLLKPEIKPNLVILAINRYDLSQYVDLPQNLPDLPDHPPVRDLFSNFSDIVVIREGPLSSVFSPYMYRSVAAVRLIYTLDPHAAKVGRIIDRWFRGNKTEPGPAAMSQALNEEGGRNFARLMTWMQNGFNQQGARVILVFLPQIITDEKTYQERSRGRLALRRFVPPGLPWLDLDERLSRTFHSRQFIGDGHYGPEAARIIGQVLAREIKRLDLIRAPVVKTEEQAEGIGPRK